MHTSHQSKEPREFFMRLFYAPLGARYINRQVLGIFLAALAVLLSIAMGDKLIQFMEKAASGNIPADRVLYIVMLRMPEMIQLVLPFALYIALVMGLSRLHSSQEMAVLQSGGLSTHRLLRWLAPLVLFVVALVGVASMQVTPTSKYALERELVELQKRIGLSALQPGVFRIEDGGKQVTYSNSLDDDDQTIRDVFIQRQLSDGRQMTVWAERGRRSIPDAQGRQTLTLENGKRYAGIAGSASFEAMSFDSLDLSINSDPVLEQVRDIESLNMSELGAIATHRAEWHWRLALPIFCLILALLAVTKAPVQPRHGQYARVGEAILWMLAYYLMLLLNRWLIEQEHLPSLLGLWPVHIAFGAVAVRGILQLGQPGLKT